MVALPMSSVYGVLIGMALTAGAMLLTVADGPTQWQAGRSAGLVAYALLWGSVCWGLLLSTRVGAEVERPVHLMEAHQFLSQFALGFGLFHGLALRHGSDLLGPLAFLIALLVMVSHRLRQQLGNRWWRRMHYAAFLAFGAAAAHAIALGRSMPSFYLLTVGTVVILTIYRILAREPARSGTKGKPDGSRLHSAGGR